MSLVALRQGMVDAFAAALASSGVKTVQKHPGRFDGEELARYGAKAPAILVALLNVQRIGDGGLREFRGLWAAYVVTHDVPDLEKDEAAIAIVEQLGHVIDGNNFGVDAAGAPQGLRADNLYAARIDKRGVALWALSWAQSVHANAVDDATLAVFETLHADYDIPGGEPIDASDDVT